MSDFDRIETDEEFVQLPETSGHPARDPIVIKGSGNVTLFGLCNSFEKEFPSGLTGKVAAEEFSETMSRLNGVLQKHTPVNLRWLVCGCLFCCCTMGCSMWPVVCLNKRTRRSLEKAMEWENAHLYYKLGLRWKLASHRSDSTNMTEYVLQIEFIPRVPLMVPD